MQLKAHELLKIIKKLKEEVKSKLKIAKTKRSEVKRHSENKKYHSTTYRFLF